MKSHQCQHKHKHLHTTMRKQPSMGSLRSYPNNQSAITVNQFLVDEYHQNSQKSHLTSKQAERQLRRAQRQCRRLQRDQHKKIDNRQQQRQNHHQYGKITNLTVHQQKSNNRQSYQQSKYLSTDTRHSMSKQLQPQVQLQQQLQKQISQLYPVKKSLQNLSRYHQQLTTQYNILLAEVHVMNKLTLPSQSCPHSAQHLRQLQQQYEQQSDNLNIHLIPKLTSIKQDNLSYCQHYNSLQLQLTQHKQLIKNSMLQSDILLSQQAKINQQLSHQQYENQLLQNKLQVLTRSLTQKQSTQHSAQSRLQSTKSQQQIKYHRQTQLLSTINQNRIKNNTLIIQSNKLKENLLLAEQINYQRALRVENLKTTQLNTLGLKKQQLKQKLHQQNKRTHELQTKLSSTQQLLTNTQSVLQFLTTKQLPQQQQQHNKLKQQLTKNAKFLSYLKKYQQQLKQTSNLMFQQLNASCQQDYDKLIKNRNKLASINQQERKQQNVNYNITNITRIKNDNNSNNYVINIKHDKNDNNIGDKFNQQQNDARCLYFSQTSRAQQPLKTPKPQLNTKQQQSINHRQHQHPNQLLTLNQQQPQQQSDGKLSQMYFDDQSSTRNIIRQQQLQPKTVQRSLPHIQHPKSPTTNYNLSNFAFNIQSVQKLIQQRAQQLNGSKQQSLSTNQ